MGDEILEVNDRPLLSAEDFFEVVQIFRRALILVLVVRKRTTVNKSLPKISVDFVDSIEDEEATRRRRSRSSYRLESIISQLSDLDDLRENSTDAESVNTKRAKLSTQNQCPQTRPSAIFRRKSQSNKAGLVPKSHTQFENRFLISFYLNNI